MLLIQNGFLYKTENTRVIRAELLIKDGKIAEIASTVYRTIIHGKIVWPP